MPRPRPKQRRTSVLLINEPPLQVLPSLAVAIGLNEAIFVQQLHYWLHRVDNERDGYPWVYNTYEGWLEQFPFWSLSTLRRVAGSLEKSGIVIATSEYNDHPSDRTKWYTLDYDKLSELEIGVTDGLSESTGRLSKMNSQPAQGEQMELSNLNTSSIRQRLPRERSDDSRFSGSRRMDSDWSTLDPITDRAAILADRHNRPEVSPAMAKDPDLAEAWIGVQKAWDQLHGKKR